MNPLEKFEQEYDELIHGSYKTDEYAKFAWNIFVRNQMLRDNIMLKSVDISKLSEEDLVIYEKFNLLCAKMENEFETTGEFSEDCQLALDEIKKLDDQVTRKSVENI